MSLQISGITYAPRIEAFARETSDEDTNRIKNDPVARSTALRQAVELVEPDWIVVSETDVLGIVAPTDGSESADGLEFGEHAADDLSEVIRILSDVHDEPVVSLVPDPVTLTLETFGEEWIALFESDEFAALDVLHEASQLLSDVVRSFEGNCSGVVLYGSRLSEVVDDSLPLDDYLLECGAVFNVADHHNVSVGGLFPSEYVDDYGTLNAEFDFVVYEDVQPSVLTDLPSEPLGCSFPDSLWDAPDTESFRQTSNEYLNALSTRDLLLMQQIPADVEPEYVQIFGHMIEKKR